MRSPGDEHSLAFSREDVSRFAESRDSQQSNARYGETTSFQLLDHSGWGSAATVWQDVERYGYFKAEECIPVSGHPPPSGEGELK
jgi:hypothetical protein